MRINTFCKFGVCLVFALSLVFTLSVHAGDQLHTPDGEVLEGTITKEIDGYIWFEYTVAGVEMDQVFSPEEYTKIVRGAEPAVAADATAPRSESTGATPRRTGAPRAAVISLGDGKNEMVGMYIVAEQLRRLIPTLEAEDIDIVVFRINSGGGYLLEIERLSDVIHEEYKPRFRTVAWIESAISAAAMTAHCIEEIYFLPQGNYGACTGWSGSLEAVKGRELEEVLYLMERISARGGYDSRVMRSMQIMEPLSASIDENGDVEYFQDLSGDIKLNDEGKILTFTSDIAEEVKFSRGTADSIQELTIEMGLEEVEWVGKTVEGVPYPISKAEADNRKWRLQTAEDERRFNEYMRDYQATLGMCQSAQDQEERGRWGGMALKNLKRIARVIRSNPNFGLLRFNLQDEEELRYYLEDQEDMIRRLMEE